MKEKTKTRLPDLYNCSIAIIGIGYVGFPLAIHFKKTCNCLVSKRKLNRKIIGYDIDQTRIEELKIGYDRTNEITKEELTNIGSINFTSNKENLCLADVYIITVPTPVDKDNKPDLGITKNACKTVAQAIIKRNSKKHKAKPVIIFESTFFPGATEEICIPIIEKESNFRVNEDFFCGYSPERINPGDKKHRLDSIKKLTSGSDEDSSKWVDNLYKSIIKEGTHLTSSIKIAEAAKVIENTQRDVNIALVNELTKIFNLLNINTLEVLEAARTKWNFLDFRPGLVGGHCIGVDPYYLTYKSQLAGYNPKVVLSGRETNNSMSKWITEKVINHMKNLNFKIIESRILIMGVTFKENCPDTRNSKVFDVINELKKYVSDITIWDPIANKIEVKEIYNVEIVNKMPEKEAFSAILCLVKHSNFEIIKNEEWKSLLINSESFIFDFKGILSKELNILRP